MNNRFSKILIAGPCSAESEEQIMSTAKALAELNIDYFRAGVWKPRTKPGGFEGVGEIGLTWLEKVKTEFGMKVATEVASVKQLNLAVAHHIDCVWIGARTTVNPFLVQELADGLSNLDDATKASLMVFIKNPVSYDIELWSGAVERILRSGIKNVGLIHRGFTPNAVTKYRNTPTWEVASEMHRRYPHLPMLCDPSHMGGKKEFVAPLAQTALDLGVQGLMIESHCAPETALSDSKQQLTPQELSELLNALVVREVNARAELEYLRGEIDNLDWELIGLLKKRMEVSRKIGNAKRKENMTIFQSERCSTLISSRRALGKSMGLNDEFIAKIYGLIHDESVLVQLNK